MYSITTNFYYDNKEQMIGLIEAVTGIGLIMGPLLGSVLYSIGGYTFIFYTMGGLFLFLSFFVKIMFPKKVDKNVNPSFDFGQLSDEDDDGYRRHENRENLKDTDK